MSDYLPRPYERAFPVAQEIVDKLSPYCDRIEIAGSLRRRRPKIGDIEIVALPTKAKGLFGDTLPFTKLDYFFAELRVPVTKNGPRYKSFEYGKWKVDLFLPASADHWGSIFTIRTGSAMFSKWLVSGEVTFHNGRLYRGGKLLDTPEEADVFDACGLPWIPLDERDDYKWLKYVK